MVGGTPQLETVGLVVVLEEVALKVQVLAGVELLDKVMLEEDFGMPLAAAAEQEAPGQRPHQVELEAREDRA